MHELSIAQNILDIVHQSVPDEDLGKVETIGLKVGKLSNVLVDSLQFCFKSLTDKTNLEGSKLEIENIPISISCLDCNAVTVTDDFVFTCDKCGSNNIKISGGEELEISNIYLKNGGG